MPHTWGGVTFRVILLIDADDGAMMLGMFSTYSVVVLHPPQNL